MGKTVHLLGMIKRGVTDLILKSNLARLVPALRRAEAEDALRTLSLAIEQSPVSVVITDPNGDIEFVNPKFVEICGYAAEEVTGKNPRVLKSGKNPEKLYEELWATITAGGIWQGELQNRKKNGELYWERASISPVRGHDGTVLHYLGIKEDITARKQAEHDLREAMQLYAILSRAERAVSTAADPTAMFQDICAACVDHGFLMAWVGMVAETGQMSALAAAGQGLDYLDGIVITINPDQAAAQGPSGQAFLTGRPVICNDFQTDPRTAPWRERAAAFGWGSSASVPFFEKGEAAGVLTFYSDSPNYFDLARLRLLEDLSLAMSRGLDRFALERQRQRLQTELRSSELRFSTIFHASPLPILMIARTDDRIVDVNAAFLRNFGHSPETVIGRTLTGIGLWSADGEAAKLVTALRRGRAVQNHALEGRTASGEPRELLVAAEFIEVEGIGYLLAMLSDVTEIRRAERSLLSAEMEKVHSMRLRSLGEVAATIAHEVNQPVGAAANYLQAALAGDPAPALGTLIDKALKQVSRAAETVKRVREFAANRSPQHLQSVALPPLVEDGCAIALLGDAGRGIELSLSMADDLPPVLADPVQIQQVITNLVRNAVEAVRTSDGKAIFIGATLAGDFVEVTVTDHGPGIPADLKAGLFKPFSTSKAEGTGLGLSISRSIIRAHGGELWLVAKAEPGASFRFSLPLAEKKHD